MAYKSANVLALGPPPTTTSIEIVWLQLALAGPVTLSSNCAIVMVLTNMVSIKESAAAKPFRGALALRVFAGSQGFKW